MYYGIGLDVLGMYTGFVGLSEFTDTKLTFSTQFTNSVLLSDDKEAGFEP